jgi:hypothetical protein
LPERSLREDAVGRSFGKLRCTTDCSNCGSEVEFTMTWDRSVGVTGEFHDTEHAAPDGSPCDLTDGDRQRGADDAAEAHAFPSY